MGFDQFKLNKQLYSAIADLGLETPTPIQEKAIPRAMAGQDILGIAQTGTGKTAAFVIPILMKLRFAQDPGPRALILTPTRELAIQIQAMSEALSKYTDLRILSIYGGTGAKVQIEAIEKGVDLLIATPGRFMDLYLKEHLKTKHLKTLVLDEADRMMDMGFMPQIRKMLEIIPVKRQNLLFSATMPDKVTELSHEFLEFPERIEITPQATAVETVEQELFYVPNMRTKLNFLQLLLDENPEEFKRVMVFTRKKTTAENIHRFISRKEIGSCRVIHSNKGQNSRINAMDEFKSGEIRLLVSTDVSSRGIDVAEVSHVINFDVPIQYDDYVHRIGRTGRALKTGKAITFCTDSEKYHIKHIEKLIRETIPLLKLPSNLKFEETLPEEKRDMAMEVDRQKRREDPDFKGAFHEKKAKNAKADKEKKVDKNKKSDKNTDKKFRKRKDKKFDSKRNKR